MWVLTARGNEVPADREREFRERCAEFFSFLHDSGFEVITWDPIVGGHRPLGPSERQTSLLDEDLVPD